MAPDKPKTLSQLLQMTFGEMTETDFERLKVLIAERLAALTEA